MGLFSLSEHAHIAAKSRNQFLIVNLLQAQAPQAQCEGKPTKI